MGSIYKVGTYIKFAQHTKWYAKLANLKGFVFDRHERFRLRLFKDLGRARRYACWYVEAVSDMVIAYTIDLEHEQEPAKRKST